jgi:hypothetical protein
MLIQNLRKFNKVEIWYRQKLKESIYNRSLIKWNSKRENTAP